MCFFAHMCTCLFSCKRVDPCGCVYMFVSIYNCALCFFLIKSIKAIWLYCFFIIVRVFTLSVPQHSILSKAYKGIYYCYLKNQYIF